MKRYLILKPSSMGDILHAFPAVHALLSAEKDTHVDWVVNPVFSDLLDYLPGVENRIFFKRKELGQIKTFFSEFFPLLKELKRERYDAVIDLQGLTRSAILGILAGGLRTYGPAAAKELPARLCYGHKLHFPENIKHAQERNSAMMSDFLHGKEVSAKYHLPQIEKFVFSAGRLLSENGISSAEHFIAIAPGARWKTKEWPPEFFAEAAAILAKKLQNISFVLLGGTAEKELCGKIETLVSPHAKCCNLCSLTGVGELIEVIRKASVLICNDSGPMHAAAAVGTPLVSVFGPTDPELTGPYGENCRVLSPEIPCLCCFKKQCDNMICHTEIRPEKLYESVVELLNCQGGCI